MLIKERLRMTGQLLAIVSVLSLVLWGFVTILTHKVGDKKTDYQFVNSILAVEGAHVNYQITNLLNTKVLNVVINVDDIPADATLTDLSEPFTTDCTSKKYDAAVLTFTKGGEVLQTMAQSCLVI